MPRYCGPHYHRLLRHGDPNGGSRFLGETRAFIEHLVKEPLHDGCVTWPFATSRGYAYVAWNGKYVSVSRLICRLVHGDPPSGKIHAAHRCGKGAQGCVNPKCLYWATKAENDADRVRHGTIPRGEKCFLSRLTDAEADAIRRDRRKGIVIAAEYGVSPAQVSRIRSGKSRLTDALPV
jgi:hypothetical protein